jgi:hypothetical protein
MKGMKPHGITGLETVKVKDCNIDGDIFGLHSDECDLGSGARDVTVPRIAQKGSGFHPASY